MSDESKAIRNLIIWFAVKVGLYYLIQVSIRRYLEGQYGTTDPRAIQVKILKDQKLHDATYVPQTGEVTQS